MEEQVNGVKNRVCGLMLILVNTVEGKELVDLSSDIQAQIEMLRLCVLYHL